MIDATLLSVAAVRGRPQQRSGKPGGRDVRFGRSLRIWAAREMARRGAPLPAPSGCGATCEEEEATRQRTARHTELLLLLGLTALSDRERAWILDVEARDERERAARARRGEAEPGFDPPLGRAPSYTERQRATDGWELWATGPYVANAYTDALLRFGRVADVPRVNTGHEAGSEHYAGVQQFTRWLARHSVTQAEREQLAKLFGAGLARRDYLRNGVRIERAGVDQVSISVLSRPRPARRVRQRSAHERATVRTPRRARRKTRTTTPSGTPPGEAPAPEPPSLAATSAAAVLP